MISKKIIRLTMISLVCTALTLPAESQTRYAPVFHGIGHYHRAISTKSPLAQQYFDQGMVLFYGFEWGESVRSFRAATKLDPECGMCYWGLSLALLDKINAPMTGAEFVEAKQAYLTAKSLKAFETPLEQAHVKALGFRFQHTPKLVSEVGAFSCHLSSSKHEEPTAKELQSYSHALQQIITSYPDDNDAKALYVYAMFDKIHWHFWDVTGKENAVTPKVLKTLEEIMVKDPNNIAANHYYVHVVEQSPHPEKALPSADRLNQLVPDSEHLIHMPAHIYFLTGRYHQGSAANFAATQAFENDNEHSLAQGFIPEANYLYLHNYNFLCATACMEGRKNVSLQAASKMISGPYPGWLVHEPNLQSFITIPYFVKLRFGLWEALLKEPQPSPQYQYALGIWHFGHGMAYAHLGDIPSAERENKALQYIIAQGKIDKNLGKSGWNLLRIGGETLLALLADRAGNEKALIAHLKKAVEIQHSMGYHEPPDWFVPMKEVLGYAYLKWHHLDEANEMFNQDLQQYPQNAWALYGLMLSLREAGHTEEANTTEKAFKIAWKEADIEKPFGLLD